MIIAHNTKELSLLQSRKGKELCTQAGEPEAWFDSGSRILDKLFVHEANCREEICRPGVKRASQDMPNSVKHVASTDVSKFVCLLKEARSAFNEVLGGLASSTSAGTTTSLELSLIDEIPGVNVDPVCVREFFNTLYLYVLETLGSSTLLQLEFKRLARAIRLDISACCRNEIAGEPVRQPGIRGTSGDHLRARLESAMAGIGRFSHLVQTSERLGVMVEIPINSRIVGTRPDAFEEFHRLAYKRTSSRTLVNPMPRMQELG